MRELQVGGVRQVAVPPRPVSHAGGEGESHPRQEHVRRQVAAQVQPRDLHPAPRAEACDQSPALGDEGAQVIELGLAHRGGANDEDIGCVEAFAEALAVQGDDLEAFVDQGFGETSVPLDRDHRRIEPTRPAHDVRGPAEVVQTVIARGEEALVTDRHDAPLAEVRRPRQGDILALRPAREHGKGIITEDAHRPRDATRRSDFIDAFEQCGDILGGRRAEYGSKGQAGDGAEQG